MFVQEFQAVVLAGGRGTRLPELSSGESIKCLLHIGPFPLLFYPLHTLQQHGFQDAIVIVLETQKNEIQEALERTPLKLKIDFATIPGDTDFGTADSLRSISDKIKTDIIVVSCDIITNASLFPVVNKFRQHNAAIACLLFSGGIDSDVTVPGPKSKNKAERDLICINPDSNRLLFCASTSDFEETMDINGHLMRKNEKMEVYSRLIDSHIYIMRKWIIDFLQKKENISTIKGELIPYIVKKQMCKNLQAPKDAQSEVNHNIKPENDIFNFIPTNILDEKVRDVSLFNDSKLNEPYDGDLIRCYALIAPKTSMGIRINTTLNYFAINQKLASLWEKIFNDKDLYKLISNNAEVKSTQIKDIAIADYAKLSEKTSLTNSIFGPSCVVNPKTIITNTIIMSHAIIEEGCKILNSIVCSHARVKKGTTLKSCLIGPNFVVEEESDHEKVHLTNADGFMEIE
ncbi:translation initiation factor eIF-2B subunit gamma [Condylostylus longicornis]|uniref:translation initiation factor eIF-2B subunit gamma n=1 Tax=Condylostylus longicornis TaxID=2530218 RepID=UPI00244E5BBA|nr:translation initiation factor eIF-2B subunit gamma [Condylostylus longicornis]